MTPRFLTLLAATLLLTFVNAQSSFIDIRAQRELAAPCPKTKLALETKRKAVQAQDVYYGKQLAEWEQVAQDLH
ncbi:hypothetical protein HK097_009772 [Rhizophlyctis rosea]|uniref:Uncharacterized protein n=1 Tax=Rhizophlyctis rosea TaxID=64517 RepID=A0AAD5SAT2_9FUNG|nr:hypothetical protein HK097_009772 [Rhizophlyctis rosea]